ncbi:MAG: ATP-binding protein [Proteobacteria bacterium]|nr:ATP-binding protein [Pseudomonadota bacterium]
MSIETLFEIRFPAKAERLCLVRSLVKRTAEVVGCSSELSDSLVIAVNEACVNVIQHAYQGDELGEIVLEMLNNEGKLHFRLVDYAHPIDLDSVKPRDLDEIRPGGLGTHFINEIMDECDMGHLEEGKGNYLEMIKKIS